MGQQRIVHLQTPEAAEVAIRRPNFIHGVKQAQRRNACVVNPGTSDPARTQNLVQHVPVTGLLSKKLYCGRRQPYSYRFQGVG